MNEDDREEVGLLKLATSLFKEHYG